MTAAKKIALNAHEPVAILGLLFGAVCWGIIWYPYRLLNEAGISGVVASLYTYGLALLIASLFYYQHWRSIFAWPMSIIGLCLAAGWTNIAYILAVLDGEVVRVMLLFYLSPIWTLLLAHFWLKERTNRRGIMVIIVALTGAFVMLFDVNLQKTNLVSYLPLPQNKAEWIALSAGMGFSLTNVITRKSSHLSIASKCFAVWLGVVVTALLILLLFNQPLSIPNQWSQNTWFVLLLIAIMLILATVFVQYGVTRITATRASVIFLFELVVATIAAYYLANETLEWNEWVGGVLIIIASLLSANQSQD